MFECRIQGDIKVHGVQIQLLPTHIYQEPPACSGNARRFSHAYYTNLTIPRITIIIPLVEEANIQRGDEVIFPRPHSWEGTEREFNYVLPF